MGCYEKCLFFLPKIEINRVNNLGRFFISSKKILFAVAVV
jgi:hypothetical protein